MAKQGKRATKLVLIAAAIKACKDKKGDIRPKKVVEAARNPKSVLHDEFEWDNAKLIQQALEARASELIRECRSFIDYGEREIIFPMFITNPQSVPAGYAETVSIARNATLKKMALETEIGRIKSAVHRAMSLAIVFGLQFQFQKLLDEVIEIEGEFAKE